MIIKINDNLAFEVSFDVDDREIGYDDDGRFALCHSGSKKMWLFPSNEVSILLTTDHAEKLASALHQAAEESRRTPRI
jgi:hypothetical protein